MFIEKTLSASAVQVRSANSQQYIGRFAPSPSGPLHFGSLVAAVGSYLQAKSQQGLWLVRIEDIDPPREVAGASENILSTLKAYGLLWDNSVVYQSKQSKRYETVLADLVEQQLCYGCSCTRKQIKEQGGIYLGNCRDKHNPAQGNALRINLANIKNPPNQFNDLLQGQVTLAENEVQDDFIIKRKDGLYAYNLAVVLDDIEQGVTEIVRGADLITTTLKQACLYQLLGAKVPSYIHLPVAVTAPSLKLSKQNHATAVDNENPIPTLKRVLQFLGHPVPKQLNATSCQQILAWAIDHWDLQKVPQQLEIQV